MQRNLNRRVEIIFPIDDPDLKEEVKHILDVQLSDNVRAHVQTDGVYEKIDRRGRVSIDCQEQFMNEAMSRKKDKSKPEKKSVVFIPKMKPEEDK